jgi:hypothetical protein
VVGLRRYSAVFTYSSPSKAPTLVRDVQRHEGLRARGRQVERVVREGTAGLDELGDRDVQDALTTGLRTGDADGEPLDTASTLARGPRELVAVALLLLSAVIGAGVGHFCRPLHVLAWFVQAGLYHHLLCVLPAVLLA